MFNISKKKITFFIIIFLIFSIFLFYWKYPISIQQDNSTPLKYADIIKKISIKNPKNFIEAEKFIIQNNNVYGTLTALYLAKTYIVHNKIDQALIQLETSLKYTQEENLKNILKLNIAKIKIEKHQNIEAMKILKSIQNNHWHHITENMKGDIFIYEKNSKLAVESWKKSLSLDKSNASKEILNMKINEFNK